MPPTIVVFLCFKFCNTLARQRIPRGSITVRLTYCLFCSDSNYLLMLNEQQFYVIGQIQKHNCYFSKSIFCPFYIAQKGFVRNNHCLSNQTRESGMISTTVHYARSDVIGYFNYLSEFLSCISIQRNT